MFFVFHLLHPSITFSQYRGNTWVFGDSTGLVFPPFGNPIVTNSSVNSEESSAVISSENGQKLFYAGGYYLSSGGNYDKEIRVWDRSNNLMQNGDSIQGSTTITQGCLILPAPNMDSLYYLFTISDSLGCICHNLFVTIVDMALQNGMGDVVIKNIEICDSLITEKMNAVRHANGRDWWVLVHGYGNADFYKYLITPLGISEPLVQTIGPAFDGFFDAGQMIFSPSGNRLAVANITGELTLYDFDRCSGGLSNSIELGDTSLTSIGWYYGCSFSPNSNLLYASYISDSLFQFDLNSINIKASRLTIFSSYTAGGVFAIGAHQISFNDNIFISTAGTLDTLDNYLMTINNPNTIGITCNLLPFGLYLNGRKSYGGLPNMPNYNLGRLIGSPCDTLTGIIEITTENSIALYPNPATDKVIVSSQQKINYYTLTNATGAIVQEKKIKPQTSFEINVKELSSGVYLLKLWSDKSFVVVKVLKE